MPSRQASVGLACVFDLEKRLLRASRQLVTVTKLAMEMTTVSKLNLASNGQASQ